MSREKKIIYPDFYCKNVMEISPEFLNENNIKGLILDVDNTLIDIDRKMLEGAKKWHEQITDSGIKTIILSNTSKEDKASGVAEKLGIEYINLAKKPFKKGFLRAKEKLRFT